MNTKTTEKTFADIAAHLKANGTVIGARDAYESLQALTSTLNGLGLGYDIAVPVDFNSDITQAPVPGWAKGEGRRRQ